VTGLSFKSLIVMNLVTVELVILQECAHIENNSLSESKFPVNLKVVVDSLILKLM
jgi:hypothetical protein